MQNCRERVRNQYNRVAQEPIGNAHAAAQDGKLCQGGQRRLAAYTEVLWKWKIIPHRPEVDTELIDLFHNIYSSIKPNVEVDGSTFYHIDSMRCGSRSCKGCQPDFTKWITKAADTLTVGRLSHLNLCLQCFKGGTINFAGSCGDHAPLELPWEGCGAVWCRRIYI